MEKRFAVALVVAMTLVSSVCLAGPRPWQITKKDLDGSWLQAAISEDGKLLARCTTLEEEEGPVVLTVTIIPLAKKSKGQVFEIGEAPLDHKDPGVKKDLAKVNKFLKKHKFRANGRAVKDLSKTTTIKGRFIEAIYQKRTFKGSTLTVKLNDKNCCYYSGMDKIIVFPVQGVMVGQLSSECRDNEDEKKPCDCDGDYPMGDEEEFKFCPTETFGTVVLKEIKGK